MAIDLLKMFKPKQQSKEDEKYFLVAEEFFEKFGERIPREMFPNSITDADIIAAMESCIKSGKNNLKEILRVRIDKNVLY